jgi:hypothetical protein
MTPHIETLETVGQGIDEAHAMISRFITLCAGQAEGQ